MRWHGTMRDLLWRWKLNFYFFISWYGLFWCLQDIKLHYVWNEYVSKRSVSSHSMAVRPGAIFFYIEKAYDMMWKEGLLIKLDRKGIGGKLFSWIKTFCSVGKIKWETGQKYQANMKLGMENLKEVWYISLLLFLIMIHYVFVNVPEYIGFADAGAVWKRGRDIDSTQLGRFCHGVQLLCLL